MAAAVDHPHKEPVTEQIASFVIFFVYLLLLKGYLLPLFIIPTGSMAATLHGANASMTCPNCGQEFAVGVADSGPPQNKATQCPNCHWMRTAVNVARSGTPTNQTFRPPLPGKSGDRIIVHGWPYELGGVFGPRRWDVVVFKVPSDGQTNYIKRLIGLPGEKIEIIDGDIYVNDKIARKPDYAQSSLWMHVYDHNHRPQQAANVIYPPSGYLPRFLANAESTRWSGLDQRLLQYRGVEKPAERLKFVTTVRADPPAAEIHNFYGYNEPSPWIMSSQKDVVQDLRLGADVQFTGGTGYIEFQLGKNLGDFFARLYADGRVTLEHSSSTDAREAWGSTTVAKSTRPVRLEFANCDYRVSVRVDGREVLASSDAQYHVGSDSIDPSADARWPRVGIAAEDIELTLANIRIDRDVYYTGAVPPGTPDQFGRPLNLVFHGAKGNPIVLKESEYFVCGDNSPASKDSRWWQAHELGPHLKPAYERGDYQLGTVTRDQMIGRAFLVYWPGFMPLIRDASYRVRNFDLNMLLPDFGRIRWIR